MSLILIYKIHSSTQMYPVTSTGKRTLIKRPVIVTLVRLSWTHNLIINFLFSDAEELEISLSAKMWINTILTDQLTKRGNGLYCKIITKNSILHRITDAWSTFSLKG